MLDTDLVVARPGAALPGATRSRPRSRGSSARTRPALAARLPVLREPVVDALIRSFSRQNAMIAAAVLIPGVDMPVLTLNQARIVLRIALAHGEPIDRSRLPELAGVVGAGFGFRAFARQAAEASSRSPAGRRRARSPTAARRPSARRRRRRYGGSERRRRESVRRRS